MSVIAPCITVETEQAFQESVAKLTPFAERVHIDASDGEFAPTFLVDPTKVAWPQNWTVDIHAMVATPSKYVQALVAKKPNLITFHVEVKEDLSPVLQYIKQSGIKAGVALQRQTVPSSVAHLLEIADHVMIFSGELGHYGGVASMMQLEKIRLIHAIRPNIEIGWDGGVNVDNAFSLVQGGVDVLNVGGAIATSADPAATYAQLVGEINKHGVI